MRFPFAAVLSLALVGCSATQTYQVSVRNNTNGPVTIGLVKEGGPFERQWASPEDAAIHDAEPSPRMWAAVPAGKTADTGPITGKFDNKSQAILRVYQGNLNLTQILSVNRDAPDRVDLPLHPGLNQIQVNDRNGRFEAVPVGRGS